MSRLALCVEGDGDAAAVPGVVGRLLPALPPPLDSALYLDGNVIKVGGAPRLSGRCAPDWLRHLKNAGNRPDLGAVLLLLDWDDDQFEGKRCCASDAARLLAHRARAAGAGATFSLAVVLVRKEFESLLIASYPALPGARPGAALPPNPEAAPRDAKRWLSTNLDGLAGGYKETRDQPALARHLDFDLLRAANNRSFRRLDHALAELAATAHAGKHVSTPA